MDEKTSRAIRQYKQRIQSDKEMQKLASRHEAVSDALQYADKAGSHMSASALEAGALHAGLSETETDAVLQVITKQIEDDVGRVSDAVETSLLRKAGTGLRPLTVEHDAERIRELAAEIAGKELTEEYLKNQLSNQAMKYVDTIVSVNAEAHDNMGMRVRITRSYDDVGLHGGKDPCQWCLSRVGDWNNYQDAYSAGAFERHPGCGCIITYEVDKTRTWQARAGRWTDL